MARRERILLDMADFRASCLGLFYLVRGWPPQAGGRQYAMEYVLITHLFLFDLWTYFGLG